MADELMWFPMWAKDYLGDPKVNALTAAQQGALVRLWCIAWDQGAIPNDLSKLQRLLPRDVEVDALNEVLREFFDLSDDGTTWRSQRQEEERAGAMQLREKRRHQTEKARARRWEAPTDSVTDPVTDSVTDSVTERPSPSPSPSPSPKKKQEQEPAAGEPWADLLGEGYAAFQGYRRAHRLPQAFEASIMALGPGGTRECADFASIGRALAQMAGNGEAWNEARLRGYIRKDREAPRAAATPDDPGGWMAALAELEAKEKRP